MNILKKKKIDGSGNTNLEIQYRKKELNHSMDEADFILGGPRKLLTLKQFAKANRYDIKTGAKQC
jgi:hypothetical protein